MKVPPPFARLMSMRAADPKNRSQSHWVLIGEDCWERAAVWSKRRHRVFTVCPPDEAPGSLDWSRYRSSPPPVGLVRCGYVDDDHLVALVTAMFTDGAPRIFDPLGDAVYERNHRGVAA